MMAREDERLSFRACDTTWSIVASGARAADATRAAAAEVLALEARLNAFDPQSRVSALYRDGIVEDKTIAHLVRRAIEYRDRTNGAFDVARGELERAVKSFIRGAGPRPPSTTARAEYSVCGDVVTTSARLDLNGIAKGAIVDAAARVLRKRGVAGFVDGGGDISPPTGPVAIESPYDADATIGLLSTRWNIATSGNSRRRRDDVDHIYDARSGRVGALHDQVTVVARRDCTEADVLATTLAALPLEAGFALVEDWPGVEALWVERDGIVIASSGMEDHLVEP